MSRGSDRARPTARPGLTGEDGRSGASRPGRARLAAVATVVAALVAAAAPAAAGQPVPTRLPTAAVGLKVPLFSPRRVPELFTGPIADARLRQQVTAITADAPPESCLSVSVKGRPAVRVNGDVPLEPASIMKLVTATALLRHAKPDEPVATTVVAGADPAGGVVEGDLWLVGGGDGLLTTEGYKASLRDREQTIVPIAALADALRAKGVTEIRGSVVGDESRYDATRYVDTWPARYRGQETVGPLSALMVNDGVTGFEHTPDRPSVARKPGDPPVLAASTFTALLEERGIHVTGPPGVGAAPAGAREVARIQSTVFDQIDEMLSWSDNTTAELLTKEVGRRASGQGTTAAGTRENLTVLQQLGVPTAGVTLVDGSGLDPGNRLTCDLLVRVLDAAGPDSVIAKALPVAGQKGTLLRRMRRTVAEGNVFAKTGTLGTVTSLAGFEKTRRGDVVTFAFIQNGPKINTALQDRLAEQLYEFPDAPDLNDLVPPARPPG
jgi:D-alanyl-D-alanine carboxypeptidase/D-alanyl-D-alanine-endopeptidase (penicillin-binding protein 4)